MKISNSKRQLAQLLIEAGVTRFPDGANWAAQGKSNLRADFYSDKPSILAGQQQWRGSYFPSRRKYLSALIPNWHQTVISRAEFDQIAAAEKLPKHVNCRCASRSTPEPTAAPTLDQIVAETAVTDADGWIEWNGGDRPVGADDLVDVKYANGTGERGFGAGSYAWNWSGDGLSIIAYRLHKPEQTGATEKLSDEAVLAAKSALMSDSIEELVRKKTLDQLLQDWRNADDYAQRKQTEADEAAAMRDERWQAVQARAGEMGVTVGQREHETTILDWNYWHTGDEVECIKTPSGATCMPGMRGFITSIREGGVYARFPDALKDGNDEWYSEFGACYRFIRRP